MPCWRWCCCSARIGPELIAQFSEAKIAQIEALRNALNKFTSEERSGARSWDWADDRTANTAPLLVPDDRQPDIGQPPRGAALQPLVEKLQEQFKRDTEVRLGMRHGATGGVDPSQCGAGARVACGRVFDPQRRFRRGAARLWLTLGGVLLLLGGTYWFARRLAGAPLAELADAGGQGCLGQAARSLPEDGPAEISRVARNVNRMAANLEQLERIAAPCWRYLTISDAADAAKRLASEISVNDAQSRDEMAADIDEIDRIVTQFLDFARGTPKRRRAGGSADRARRHRT